MKCPAEVYKPSLIRYPETLPEPIYLHHDLVRHVNSDGLFYFQKKAIFISQALADQTIGLEEEQDGIWRINFMDLDLGFFDEQTRRFTPVSPEDSDLRLSEPSGER